MRTLNTKYVELQLASERSLGVFSRFVVNMLAPLVKDEKDLPLCRQSQSMAYLLPGHLIAFCPFFDESNYALHFFITFTISYYSRRWILHPVPPRERSFHQTGDPA